MTALTRFFFRSAIERPSTWSTIQWWEARRPAYNVAVGVTGLVTLGVVAGVSALPPHAQAFPVPWMAPLVYGFLANVCYSLGAPVELALRRLIGDDAGIAGAAIFRYGFVFSIGLTLIPAAFAVLDKVARIAYLITR
jgi:hypothetical protein